MSLLNNIRRIFTGDSVEKQMESLDHKNRVIRHDLINIQQRTDAIRRLVEQMREDDIWNRQ